MIERLRNRVSKRLDKIGRYVPIPANVLTVLSPIVVSVLLCLGFYLGNRAMYLLAIILGGLLDVLDGAVARSRGSTSPVGAFLDSVSDRFVDAVLMIPLAYIADGTTAIAAATGALMISYVRARAEALCVEMRGVGFMERGERMLILVIIAVMWIVNDLIAMLLAKAFAALLMIAAVHRAWAAYILLRRREGGCSKGLSGEGGG